MNDDQLLRYSRHILLPQLDINGQQTLIDSHVMIIGLGGLGAPVSMYLAASGIGKLTLVDDDEVELSNLQRQIVHGQQDIGREKVASAADKLCELNPDVSLQLINQRLDKAGLMAATADVDVLVDCSDNFATRFLLNEVSREQNLPLVSGAAIRFEAQITVYDPRQAESPCYRCLYEDKGELEQSCSESGVLAPMLAMVGGTQAVETIKLLTGVGESLAGRLLLLDALSMQWREIKMKQDPDCPVCSQNQEQQ
ncbi:Sulfur carrier protein adenylyltransferase ThiF [Methylophaga thiooxydans]|uniref:Molybdopterin-synthase adenylyltransferase n=1 Tax=Methylophaga thiooxydans TaxID=392484 RepID=A0A0A0BJH9_9GAMM|nr:molybdopterin-synthase adenylyltransferase MoeB [Methylophaga thiooxydans]KGM08146.1 Sulfur carrier protein adenylyltransferase ThiF [Methylophaga thiooxydans]